MAEPRRPSSSSVHVDGARFLVVEARYYDDIGGLLLAGARRALEAAGATLDVIGVPGALEIPVALALSVEDGGYAGAVALGCIIRGETYHFEIVANESARGADPVRGRLAAAVRQRDPYRGDGGAGGRARRSRPWRQGRRCRARGSALWRIKHQRDAG